MDSLEHEETQEVQPQSESTEQLSRFPLIVRSLMIVELCNSISRHQS
ncbi:MAG: hypothetical protein QM501_01215 [Gimesia sp.]